MIGCAVRSRAARAAMQPAAPEGPWKVLLRSFVLMGPYRFGFIATNGPLAGICWAHRMLLEPCCARLDGSEKMNAVIRRFDPIP